MQAKLVVGEVEIPLAHGLNVIGRFQLQSTDPKLSRKQIEVHFDEKTGALAARKPAGRKTNASYVVTRDGSTRTEVVAGNDYDLVDGDTLQVISAFPCKVHVRPNTPSVEPSPMPDAKAFVVPTQATQTQALKRPLCRFGASCYRRNPDHFRDFAHPWKGETDSQPTPTPAGAASPPHSTKRPATTDPSGTPSPGRKRTRTAAGVSFTPANPLDASLAASLAAAEPTPPPSPVASAPTNMPPPPPPATKPPPALPTRSASTNSDAATPAGGHLLLLPVLSAGKEFQFPAPFAASVLIDALQVFTEQEQGAVMEVIVVVDDGDDDLNAAVSSGLASAQAGGKVDARVSAVMASFSDPSAVCLDARAAKRPITVVNRCNWRLNKGGRDPVNKALHTTIGPELAIACHMRKKTLELGETCTIKLDRDHHYRETHGIRWVVNVLGPTMNSLRGDSVSDTTVARAQLMECYESVFSVWKRLSKSFASFRGGSAPSLPSQHAVPPPQPPRGGVEEFKTDPDAPRGGVEETKADPDPPKPSLEVAPQPAAPQRSGAPSWAAGLQGYVDGTTTTGVLHNEPKCVIVADAYPKAKHHYLLIPKDAAFKRAAVSDLTKAHLVTLKALHARAKRFARERCPGVDVRIGYHAVPSMKPLHIHIISTDMVAPALKTKKHYLSFTTSFFLEVDAVEGDLEWGSMEISAPVFEAMLKGPLVCHRCRQPQPNMPRLKDHLTVCTR